MADAGRCTALVAFVEDVFQRSRGLPYIVRTEIDAITENMDSVPVPSGGARLFCSPSHRRKTFKASIGISRRRFIRRFKVHCCLGLLVNDPSMRIGSLADAVGYEHQGNLSRVFREEITLSPRLVRDVIRERFYEFVGQDRVLLAARFVDEKVREEALALAVPGLMRLIEEAGDDDLSGRLWSSAGDLSGLDGK